MLVFFTPHRYLKTVSLEEPFGAGKEGEPTFQERGRGGTSECPGASSWGGRQSRLFDDLPQQPGNGRLHFCWAVQHDCGRIETGTCMNGISGAEPSVRVELPQSLGHLVAIQKEQAPPPFPHTLPFPPPPPPPQKETI